VAKHADLVKNDFHNLEQVRYGIFTAEVSKQPDLEASMLQVLIDKYGDGSYFFMTGAHDDDDCPFKESDRVPMSRMIL